MTNGVMHTGSLPVGDLDLWSFTANVGDRIVVRMGEVTTVNNFEPSIRLYGPDGTLLGSTAVGNSVKSAEVAVTNTTNGMFTVVVGEREGTTAGDYRLTLAQSPGAITVSPGDEGGPMINAVVYTGTISNGDLDVWTFNACEGAGLNLRVDELPGAIRFDPTLRLYAPNGTLLANVSGATTAQINLTAPALGGYTLIVGDTLVAGDTGANTGTYQLTGIGIWTDFILCKPLINGTNLIIQSVGGPAGSNYVLLTATNVASPLNTWTPIRTNQFGTFGEFYVTNLFSPTIPQ